MKVKDLDFSGKVALITGGTRGIGFATAKAFAEHGAQVVIFGSRAETVTKATEKFAESGLVVQGYCPDLNNYAEIEQTVAEIVQQAGKIDILINNAGITLSQKLEDTPADDFARVLDLNVRAVLYLCKAVVPYLKRQGGGVILNTSSMVSFDGQASGAGYPASKAAVNGLTKSLARELASDHIRVNAVAPGVINTDMMAKLPPTQIQPLVQTIPLGRIGEPEEVANAFLFLASDLAGYITGTILRVDGGTRS